MIQEGWKKYILSDFIIINPTVKLQKNESYSFIEMKDLDPSRKFTRPSCKKVLCGGAKFEEGDTLFARITPCLENGKICMVKGLENGKGFGSTEFLVLRGKKDVSDSEFVYYLSRSEDLRNEAIMKMTGTSGRQRVETSAFKNIEIIVPENLFVQASIASILASLDDKIEINLQMNKTLEAIAQAIFKEWFDGEKTVCLDNYIEFNPKVTIKAGAKTKYIEMADLNLTGSTISSATERQFTAGSKFMLHDTLLSRITPCLENGKTGFVDFLDPNEVAFGSTEFIVMRAKPGISPYYVYLLARDDNFRAYAIKSMTGTSGRQRVQTGMLNAFLVPSLNLALMERFHNATTPLFEKIRMNALENKVLLGLRDELLPRLMSGSLQLS